ncbi:MAG: hypothetical protein B6I38_01440 [Anaerolineaceae bacterium 4572_5.1]|nr:MAG: hypothetical protein B6I38_01440 [Anaerolineaceae bacterium 4572_5.1]RLD11010.1 MAG: hypothetical protein DRI56_01790 [Chloroflexota bacterium]
MPLSASEWDKRFRQQAVWTQDLRHYLYPKIGLKKAENVLDVGCGTGALIAELTSQSKAQIYGLDLDLPRLKLAMRKASTGIYSGGNAQALPFPANVFDLTLSHFLLLWVDDPVRVVQEMRRVTTPGGSILALAEPDYGGRLDYPPSLAQLKEIQTKALRRQGADPHLGRKLRSIFAQAGCQEIVTGVLGGQWFEAPTPEELNLEWSVIAEDAGEEVSAKELRNLELQAKLAWERNERTLFVPTFYAWGKA